MRASLSRVSARIRESSTAHEIKSRFFSTNLSRTSIFDSPRKSSFFQAPRAPPRPPASRLVYGKHAVELCLTTKSREPLTLYVSQTSDVALEMMSLAKSLRVPVEKRTKFDLDRLLRTGEPTDEPVVHQGFVLRTGPLFMPTNKTLSLEPTQRDRRIVVALDGLVDPRNVGAALRVAHFFGVHAVLVGAKDASALDNGVVSKASSGSLEILASQKKLILWKSMNNCLEQHRKEGWRVIGTSASPAPFIKVAPLDALKESLERVVLVFGSEGDGLSEVTLQKCHAATFVPHRKSATVPTFVEEHDRRGDKKAPVRIGIDFPTLNVGTAVAAVLSAILNPASPTTKQG